MSFLPIPTIDAPEHTSTLPVPTLLFYSTPSPKRPPSWTIKTLKRTTAFPRRKDMTSQPSFQLESTVSVPFSLTKALPDYHDTVFDTEEFTHTTLLLLLVVKVILSNLALCDPQPLTIDDLSLATIVAGGMKCTLYIRLSLGAKMSYLE